MGDIDAVLESLPTRDEREPVVQPGQGGDDTTAIDQAAEDAIVARLEALGGDFVLVSEELGERSFGAGGSLRVVVDPIDGSVNAKRGIPFFSFSLAVAEGPAMEDVVFGYVYDFGTGEEWTAERGSGAFLGGEPLDGVGPKERIEILSFEGTTARAIAERIEGVLELVGRVRVMGSLALSLCHLAAGRVDAVCSLKPARSVDIAAAQLLVRERGLAIELFDDPPFGTAPLDLVQRSRLAAAGTPELVSRACRRAPVGATYMSPLRSPDDVRPRAERRVERLRGGVADAQQDAVPLVRVEDLRDEGSRREVLRREDERPVVGSHLRHGGALGDAGVRRDRRRVDPDLPVQDGGVGEQQRAVLHLGGLDRVRGQHRRGIGAREIAARGDAVDRPRRALRADRPRGSWSRLKSRATSERSLTFDAVTAPSLSCSVPTEPRGRMSCWAAAPSGVAPRSAIASAALASTSESRAMRPSSASSSRFLAGTLVT